MWIIKSLPVARLISALISIKIVRMQFRLVSQCKNNSSKMMKTLRAFRHVRSLTGTTGAPEIALSREQYRVQLQLLILLLHFARGHGPREPIKLTTTQISDSPIGEITFPGQWRRVDNISNDVPLIQNCHSRDILQCKQSGGKRTGCKMRFQKK